MTEEKEKDNAEGNESERKRNSAAMEQIANLVHSGFL